MWLTGDASSVAADFVLSYHTQTDTFFVARSESMGVSADATSRAFPSKDVDAFMKRIYGDIKQDIYGGSDYNTNHVIIAVDPSGGGSSQFAVFSIAQLPNGSIMVRMANFPISRPATFLPEPSSVSQTHPATGKYVGKTLEQQTEGHAF